jgi:hypothetical protein
LENDFEGETLKRGILLILAVIFGPILIRTKGTPFLGAQSAQN